MLGLLFERTQVIPLLLIMSIFFWNIELLSHILHCCMYICYMYVFMQLNRYDRNGYTIHDTFTSPVIIGIARCSLVTLK